MKNYISEDRAIYEDLYHGQFSRKLAKWAISMMKTKNDLGKMVPITSRSFDDVVEVLETQGVEIPDGCLYTAWYVFNMAIADYQHSLPNDKMRSTYVEETLCDPDGDSTNVLACFEAKMCNASIPIYWERML